MKEGITPIPSISFHASSEVEQAGYICLASFRWLYSVRWAEAWACLAFGQTTQSCQWN